MLHYDGPRNPLDKERTVTSDLPSWPRPLYRPGAGKPFLLYLVFGAFGAELSPSQARHRVSGVPRGLRVDGFAANEPGLKPFFDDEPFASQLSDHEDLAAALADAPACMRFIGELEDQPTLDYLRDVIGLVVAALDAGGVAVLDPQTLTWWTAREFRSTFFDHGGPAPLEHVALLASDEGGGAVWLHTRGMRKFGRPDLSLRGVREHEHEGAVALMHRLVQRMADGEMFSEGQEIEAPSLGGRWACHHEGSLEDPDFNNVRLEIHRGT